MSHEENQQERPSENLAWLAAIVEGEGCLRMGKQHWKKGGCTRYYPLLSVVNTDVALMDEVSKILKANLVGFHISNRQRNERSKPTFEIKVSGIKRMAKLLPLIIPYMRGKKRRAAVLLKEYVEKRMSVPYKAGFGFDKDMAENVYQQICQINQTGILRDFTPVVLKIDDDKVRTAWRHAESLPTQSGW